jgi:hypothetical protein
MNFLTRLGPFFKLSFRLYYTESAEDNNTRPKLTGALASLRDNSGTLKILDYVEKSGDGKVIRSYHESSSSKKGRAR